MKYFLLDESVCLALPTLNFVTVVSAQDVVELTSAASAANVT